MAPQPPGPGFPEQAPSVKMSTRGGVKAHTPWPRELFGESAAAWRNHAGPLDAQTLLDRDLSNHRAWSAGNAGPRRVRVLEAPQLRLNSVHGCGNRRKECFCPSSS